jgi:hypothetical protein
MKGYRSAAVAASFGLILSGAAPVAAAKKSAPPQARVRLPIVGTAAGGATFAGTLSIERFAVRGSSVVAVGMVTGAVTDGSGTPIGSVLVGKVELPVLVGAGAARAAATPSAVITQATCQVLHLDIGAINLNLLGLQFATAPITIDLAADDAEVLGQLICTALELVGNVVGLVDILNQILGLLTGLLGGLTGGLPV